MSHTDSIALDSQVKARIRELADTNSIYKDTALIDIIQQNKRVKTAFISDKKLIVVVNQANTAASMAKLYCNMAKEHGQDIKRVVVENDNRTVLAESECQ